MLLVIPYKFLLVEGGCPLRDSGRSTGVGRAEKGDWYDERLLRYRHDELEVAVLASSVGTLDLHHVFGEEMISILDGRVVWFTCLLGEGRVM